METRVAPLAVWDINDGKESAYWAHWSETSPWAIAHFPNRAEDVYRAEFYLLDAPFVILYRFAEDEQGRRYIDPATGEAAIAEPLRMILGELPPEHLLRGKS